MGVDPGFPINPVRIFEDVTRYWDEKVDEEIHVHSRIPRRFELDSGNSVGQRQKVQQGEEILNNLNRCLDEFRFERTPPQIQMHEAMVTCCLPKILGPEYDRFAEQYKREQGWTEIPMELLLSSYRRAGKTTGTAMFVAAFALTVPRCRIVIFSMALRQATSLLKMVDQMINYHPEGRKMLTGQHTQTHITLKGPYGIDDERNIDSYPGGSVDVSIYFIGKCVFVFIFSKG